MKENKENKVKKEEVKDNKNIKWTPFPTESKVNYNFSAITPPSMNLKCIKTFPV